MDRNALIYKLRRNTLVRCLYFPVASIIDKYRMRKYKKSKSSEYILSLKDKYNGKRCFIIGNGPSLTINDLNKLKFEFTFATNRIYQLFDKTNWRPTFYLSTDLDVINKGLSDINKLKLDKMFFNYNARKKIKTNPDHTTFIYFHGKFRINRHGSYQEKVNEELNLYFSTTENVVCSCIEFAMFLGFKEIYLIGVDNSYNKNGGYANGMHGGVKPDFNLDALAFTYNTFKKYADSHGIILMNATRGGELDYIKRVELDSLV